MFDFCSSPEKLPRLLDGSSDFLFISGLSWPYVTEGSFEGLCVHGIRRVLLAETKDLLNKPQALSRPRYVGELSHNKNCATQEAGVAWEMILNTLLMECFRNA